MASATKDRVLDEVRRIGSAGVTHSALVELIGAKKGTVTRAVNVLREETLVRVDGELVKPVLRNGRRLIVTEVRDQTALDAIRESGASGLTVQEVAEVLEVSRSLAYQCVYRLRVAGQVTRRGETRRASWVAVDR